MQPFRYHHDSSVLYIAQVWLFYVWFIPHQSRWKHWIATNGVAQPKFLEKNVQGAQGMSGKMRRGVGGVRTQAGEKSQVWQKHIFWALTFLKHIGQTIRGSTNLGYLQIWPPVGATCTGTTFGQRNRWRHLPCLIDNDCCNGFIGWYTSIKSQQGIRAT